MIPAKLDATRHTHGDMWRDTYHFGPITDENGNPPLPLPALYCRMQFRDKAGVLGYSLSSDPGEGEGTITIVNPTTYEFDVPVQPLPLPVGKWAWDFETFTAADHSVAADTWFAGTITVVQDMSHD